MFLGLPHLTIYVIMLILFFTNLALNLTNRAVMSFVDGADTRYTLAYKTYASHWIAPLFPLALLVVGALCGIVPFLVALCSIGAVLLVPDVRAMAKYQFYQF